MKHTENRQEIISNKIVIFGAGKIGRSFIGQLFGSSGYSIVFVDVDPVVISLLNERKGYRVIIKGDSEEVINISEVSAINGRDPDAVATAVAGAGIAAVSVGKNALEKVLPFIAAGLVKRHAGYPDRPLDIILAENMRSAAEFTAGQLRNSLPQDFPLESYVGLIETSIGKMVPIMPSADIEKDPLQVFAEPYNTLILDGRGFKSAIPDVKGLAPKNNIKAWVDRKAFIHNLGHATAAYYGNYHYPQAVYMYEILDHPSILNFTRKVMLQSAGILREEYPGEFTTEDLEHHIDDLLHRFRNKVLRDTIFRVGQDLARKLGHDDRFMGAINLARSHGKDFDLILEAMSYGFTFSATDEDGHPFPGDVTFREALAGSFDSAVTEILGYNVTGDEVIIEAIRQKYKKLLVRL